MKFNWTEQALRDQFNVAKTKGWLLLFKQAAATFGFTTAELMGCASRESGPFWAGTTNGIIMGDKGHAWGIFQINDNFNPDPDTYKLPEQNIPRGASILAANRARILKRLHEAGVIADSELIAKMIYASYNRGVSGMWKGWTEKQDPDWSTANQNYGADCIARAVVFQQILDEGEGNG